MRPLGGGISDSHGGGAGGIGAQELLAREALAAEKAAYEKAYREYVMEVVRLGRMGFLDPVPAPSYSGPVEITWPVAPITQKTIGPLDCQVP